MEVPMITKTYNIVLQIGREDIVTAPAVVVQNDNDVYSIRINVFDGNTEIDYSQVESATITFVKEDKNVVQGNLLKDANGFTYEMGTNEIACPGTVIAAVQLIGPSNERLTTSRFKFKVINDMIIPSAVQSTTEFAMLQQLKTELEAINVVSLQNEVTAHKADNVNSKTVHGIKIETGTFTPYITGSSGAGTFAPTYTMQGGRYHKINERVFFDIDIQFSGYTGTFSGAFRIAGLPFSLTYQSSAGITILENYIFDASAKFLALTIIGTTIVVNQIRDNNTVIGTTNANLGQTFRIRCFGEYITN